MKLKENYHLYAIITIFFWASAYVFIRLGLRYFTPYALGALRYYIAAVFLVVFSIFVKIKMPEIKDLKWFFISGFFGFSLFMVAFHVGSATVSASTASLVIAITPVLTTLMARIILKEKLKLIQYIATVIEFIGVGVLTLMNGILSINIGILWLLLASFSLSAYNLLQRRITKKYSSIQASVISIWFGAALLIFFLPQTAGEVRNAPAIYIIYMLVLGIFPSAIAYICWAHALSKVKNASSVTNYMFLTPFLTTIMGVLFAKEIPDSSAILGGIIILFGLFLFNFFDKIVSKLKNHPAEN